MSGRVLRGRFVCEGLEPRTLLAAIVSSTTTPGNISAAGEVDDYEFDAAAGERIVLSLGEVTPTYEPFIELRGPGGALVSSASGNGGALINVLAPTTGSYTARVFEFGNNETGEYLLHFLKVPHAGAAAPDPFDGDGGTVASNSTSSAAIDTIGDFDTYFVDAAAGERLVVSVSEVTPAYEPFVVIYGPGGAEVGAGQGNFSALVEQVAPTAGRYSILVFEVGDDEVGEYLLHFAKLPHTNTTPNPFDGDGGVLASNSTTSAAVDQPGDFDLYVFDASAGERIVLSVSEVTPAYEPYLALYGPGGAQIDNALGNFSAYIESVAPATGTYVALVFEYVNDEAGDYLLHFARLPHTGTTPNPFDGDGGVVASDTTTSAAVDQAGDFDLYVFDAAAGERMILSLSEMTPAYEPFLALYGPGGAQVDTAQGNFSAYIEAEAPTTGRYVALVLEVANDEAGEYLLHYVKLPYGGAAPNSFDGDGGALASNTTTAASVDAPGDFDVYSLQAAAGERIILSLGEVTSAYEPAIALYGPGGAQIVTTQGNFGALIEQVAPSTGTYNVVVMEFANDESGDYRLHYAKLPFAGNPTDPADGDGATLGPSGNTNASIDTAGDFDLYQIPAIAGERLTVSVTESAATTAYEPYVALYSPTGERIDTAQGAATASVQTTASSSGTYTVLVFDFGDDEAGDYVMQFIRKANVMGRALFYNNSAYDTGGNDDNAIATDKTARMPSQTATFNSVSSFNKGINGIMVDVAALPGQTLSAADFLFKYGPDGNPANWVAAPAPAAVNVRKGAGPAGADRVVITWSDNAIRNQWLQVTMLANDATNLLAQDVFYFGSLVGDTGDSPLRVNALDLAAARRVQNRTLPITGKEDVTRDGRVNALDLAAIRANINRTLGGITGAAVPGPAAAPDAAIPATASDLLRGTPDADVLDG